MAPVVPIVLVLVNGVCVEGGGGRGGGPVTQSKFDKIPCWEEGPVTQSKHDKCRCPSKDMAWHEVFL